MLIDATHPEETRVVVVSGKRLEEFDVEIASRKQLKGNIYLAKVVRVEPSLQAAFVDYGGNRHGFLAFNEIHPDYYRIPIADREALQAELEAQAARNSRDDPEIDPIEPGDGAGPESAVRETVEGEAQSTELARDLGQIEGSDAALADGEEPGLPALGEEESEHRPSASEDAIAEEAATDNDTIAEQPPAAALERSDVGDDRLEGPVIEETEDHDAEDRGAAEGMAAEVNGDGSSLEESADELPGAPVSGGVEQHAAIAPERIETLGGDEADE
jgi:ribonuclease E